MKRRSFLSATAAAALLSGRRLAAAERRATALVVGAGMAGIAAARTLAAQGASVIVLEARSRLGGRVWTDRSLGLPLDFGASWIHGIDGNPITGLAAELSVATRPTDYDDVAVYDFDGSRVGESTLAEIAAAWDEVMGEVEAYGGELGEGASIGQAVAASLAGETLSADERRALGYVRSAMVVTAGAELEELSLRYSDDDDGFGGGDRLFPGGYDQIVTALARGLDVRLEHRVAEIRYAADGVGVVTDRGAFSAEGVIVTVPLGVLKAGSVRFSPPLPESKREAIEGLGMGVLNKLALKFPAKFWDDREFIGHMGESAGDYPQFLNWHHYAGQPVLLGFTGGDFARRLEQRSDADAAAGALAVLRRIYGAAVSEPTGVKLARWASDPLAGGSYSHVRPGASSALYDVLAEPLSDGRVRFAGEATSRAYRGTVHGAYLSGVREAARALQDLG